MTNYRFIKFCHFLLDFLNVYKPVSKIFQREKIFTQVKSTVDNAIESLDKLLTVPESKEKDFTDNVEGSTFHGICLQQVELGEKKFLADRERMLVLGKNYLQKRFLTDNTVLNYMKVFDTVSWPKDRHISSYGNVEILALANHFKKSFPTKYDKEVLLNEWFDLKSVGRGLSFDVLIENAIGQPARFKFLSTLMAVIACVPVSTASCERGFSAMNRIKTSDRSRLAVDTTNNLMMVAINGVTVMEYDPVPAIEHWFLNSSGRRVD